MNVSRDRWVLGATLLSESAWLFVLLGVVGLVLGLGGSPLMWPIVLAVLFLSMIIRRLAPTEIAAVEAVYLAQFLIAVAVVYFTVATSFRSNDAGADLAWITRVGSDAAPKDFVARAVLSSISAAVLWLRGAWFVTSKDPAESLILSFRIGSIALAIGVFIDILHPADLSALPAVFVFFASGLAGLVVGHLMPAAQRPGGPRRWTIVTAGVISAVLLGGMLFGLIHRTLQSLFAGGVTAGFEVLFWGAVAPIAIAYNLFVDGVIAFFGRPFEPELGSGGLGFDGETSTEPLGPLAQAATGTLQMIEEETEEVSEAFALFLQILEGVLITTIVVVVLVLLALALRRLVRRSLRSRSPEPEREAATEDTNALADMVSLLSRLIPNLRNRGRQRSRFNLPDGPPGVVEVLRIYYSLLNMAERVGFSRGSHETSGEFQHTLEEIFPSDLVRTATLAFDRALYGHHSTPEEEIAEMRESLRLARARLGKARANP